MNWRTMIAPVALAVALTGCGDGEDLAKAIEENLGVKVRVLHASPDAPEVNILVDGAPVLTEVDFKEGSPYLDLAVGFTGWTSRMGGGRAWTARAVGAGRAAGGPDVDVATTTAAARTRAPRPPSSATRRDISRTRRWASHTVHEERTSLRP